MPRRSPQSHKETQKIGSPTNGTKNHTQIQKYDEPPEYRRHQQYTGDHLTTAKDLRASQSHEDH